MEKDKDQDPEDRASSGSKRLRKCKVCKGDLEGEGGNVCSEASCRQQWRLLCKACKKRPRTSRKFCSEACRDSVVRYARNSTQRPICKAFFEDNNGCNDDRCFFRHEAPPRREADLIFSVHKTHQSRLESYLSERFNLGLSLQESIAGAKGKCGSLPDQIFVYALLDITTGEASHDVQKALQTLQKMRRDPVLARVIQRIFIVDFWAIRFREVVDKIVEKLGNAAASNGCEELKCRVIAHPRALERSVIEAIQSSVVGSRVRFNPLKPRFLIYVFTGQDGTYSSAVVSLGEDVNAKMVCNGLAQLSSRDTASGEQTRRVSKDQTGAPSKASQKLEEVMLRMGIRLDDSAVALDVGASPGGWSKVLSPLCKRVIAVDPGELRVDAANVEHWKRKIQDCPLEELKFDIVVCDMNVSVDELIPLTLKRLSDPPPHLVLTCKRIKPQGSARSFREGVDRLIGALTNEYMYQDVTLVHLMSNKETERTIYATNLK